MNLHTRLNEKDLWAIIMKLWKDLANAMYVPQSGVPTHRRHVLWEVGRLCNSSPICPNDSFHDSRLRQVQVSYISLLTKRRQPSQAASPRQAYISAWSRGSHQRRSGCGGSRHGGRPLWGSVWHTGLVRVVKVGPVPMATRAHRVPELPQEPAPVKKHEEQNAVNKKWGGKP